LSLSFTIVTIVMNHDIPNILVRSYRRNLSGISLLMLQLLHFYMTKLSWYLQVNLLNFLSKGKHLQSSSLSILVSAETSNSTQCLLSSLTKWVIDSGATDHMIGYLAPFSSFQYNTTSSSVTLADGSTLCVLGTGIINPTPYLSLLFVFSLPQFSFNLLSVSKLIRASNCCISFFLNHCVF
jgi:hypothetical protein